MTTRREIPKTKEQILRLYNIAIVHLRNQYKSKKIGISIGAGVSAPLSFPSWRSLVESISRNISPDIDIYSKFPETSLVSNSQRLFEYFRESTPRDLDESDRAYDERVKNKWKRIVSICLYVNNKEAKESNIRSHPYLEYMMDIIKVSNLIINFNFDDTIEHALDIESMTTRGAGRQKKYEVRWDLSSPIRNDVPTIFHPNGYIPHRKHDYASDNIVFLEDSFLERLILGRAGDDSVCVSQYINNTYIHVGLSLTDEVLKTILQKSWRAAPANIHFQIHYCEDDFIESSVERAIVNANFSVLNLYTIIVGNDGIRSFFELITMSDPDFLDLCRREGFIEKYVFYVTGPVGSGKTTTVNHFKNFLVIDEWLESSPDIVSKPYDSLSDKEKNCADSWIGNQFFQKNLRLLEKTEGIFIVDRCSLDPITFETGDKADRAIKLIGQISPGVSNYHIAKGVVFNLIAEPFELKIRLIRKWKFWNEETIKQLSSSINELYDSYAINIDTRGRTAQEVVRAIVSIIFFSEYKPVDLHGLVARIAESRE